MQIGEKGTKNLLLNMVLKKALKNKNPKKHLSMPLRLRMD
jgi:hypothetical protein